MFWSLLHRMILWELVKIFLLALCGLTGILLMATIFAEASRNGLSPSQIMMIIPLLIPSTLPYTLPTTTLFATCVVYGRLAHDNEILAIKSAGINILRVVWPGILLGIIVSAVTVGLYYHLIPRTHFLLRAWLIEDVEEFMYSMLKREGRIVHPKLSYEIYVKRVLGRKLLDAQFMRRDATGQHYDIIARAREAELHVDLVNKQILVHMRSCQIANNNGEQGYVEKKEWPIEIPDDFINPGKSRACDMTWQEMCEQRGELDKELQNVQLDLAMHTAMLNMGNAPPNIAVHVRDRENQKRRIENEAREITAEMHSRPALALGCLCFVLIGCPVGIWLSRSDYLSAFIACFLPIVIIYYPLMLCGINAGRMGRIPPVLAIWAANSLMGVASLPLYRKLLKN